MRRVHESRFADSIAAGVRPDMNVVMTYSVFGLYDIVTPFAHHGWAGTTGRGGKHCLRGRLCGKGASSLLETLLHTQLNGARIAELKSST